MTRLTRPIYRIAADVAGHLETFCEMEARRLAMDLDFAAEAPTDVRHFLAYQLDVELAAVERWRARRIRWAGRADGLIAMASYAPASLDANGAEVVHA